MAADEGSGVTMFRDPAMRDLFDVLVDVATRWAMEKRRPDASAERQAEISPDRKGDGDEANRRTAR